MYGLGAIERDTGRVLYLQCYDSEPKEREFDSLFLKLKTDENCGLVDREGWFVMNLPHTVVTEILGQVKGFRLDSVISLR